MFVPWHFILFQSAAGVLALMPGPGIFYVAASALAGGRDGVHGNRPTVVPAGVRLSDVPRSSGYGTSRTSVSLEGLAASAVGFPMSRLRKA